MHNRTALVTGGMGGLGTIIAQRLADSGARVGVTYNKQGNHEIAKEWQTQQQKLGYDFAIFYVDLSDFASTAQMVNTVIEKFSRIDILINNAGVTEDSTLAKMSVEQWYKVINNNLNSIFHVTRHVLQYMIKHEYGRIINISSINGQKGQFGQTNYCAAKAGMHGFTKALAHEVAKKGITVNTISPGYINTAMLNKVTPQIIADIIKQIPVGRLGEPHEVARTVEFLAATEAGYITGSNFSVNGGQHMF